MTKINFLPLKIKSEIKPKLELSVNHLSSAIDDSRTLNVPSDFEYANELNQLDYELTEIRKNIESFNYWLDHCEKKYNHLDDELSTSLKQINKVNIRKYMSIDM